jgi:hypothetical protein
MGYRYFGFGTLFGSFIGLGLCTGGCRPRTLLKRDGDVLLEVIEESTHRG